jgi:SAM-dependent methyltransferase
VNSGRLDSNSRVLEIGIGTGRIALPLAARVGEVCGVDLARRMMGRLREKQSTEPITLIEADATRLPFAAASFDAAVAVHVFHLIPGWQEVVEEVARALKPEGVLLLGQNEHTRRNPAFQSLSKAWESAVPAERPRRVGVPEEKSETFLTELGWDAIGATTVPFTFEQSPMEYFHRLEHRLYSESWLINDEEHERAMVVLRRALKENYSNPDLPVVIDSGFDIQGFRPPRTW